MELFYEVQEEQEGWKLKRLIYAHGLSSSLWKRIKWNGTVEVNGVAVHNANTFLHAGDRIRCEWSEVSDIVPTDMALDMVYEDDTFLVVNKPKGMLIHPTTTGDFSSLVNGVAAYFQKKGESSGVHPVYRLDRNTTGLVLVAKSAKGQYDLSRSHDLLYREYIAIAEGVWTEQEGLLDEPIGRKEGSLVEWVVRDDGKAARTEYTVLRQEADFAVLRLHLLTGRTHQIRVHLSHKGHPLLGDELYGGDTSRMTRQALHAYSLRFRHPERGESMHFVAPLPVDMQAFCEGIEDIE